MPQQYYIYAAFWLGAYVLGCLNFGYYVVRIFAKADVRAQGSGSAGATNAGRVLGKRGFVLISILDGLKGLFTVILSQKYGLPLEVCALALFFCLLGHIYPAQLNFRGGKGMASAVGGLLPLCPLLMGLMVAFFALSYLLTRKYHKSGIFAILSLPPGAVFCGFAYPALAAICLITVLMLWQYRGYFRGAPDTSS